MQKIADAAHCAELVAREKKVPVSTSHCSAALGSFSHDVGLEAWWPDAWQVSSDEGARLVKLEEVQKRVHCVSLGIGKGSPLALFFLCFFRGWEVGRVLFFCGAAVFG